MPGASVKNTLNDRGSFRGVPFDPAKLMLAEQDFDLLTRPGRDEWGLLIAAAIATRGDCRRRRIGAIILDSHFKVIGSGYNGVAPGESGCIDGTCPRGLLPASELPPDSSYNFGFGSCVAAHAEQSAITDAGAERLQEPYACTIYVSQPPCPGCQNLIIRYRLNCVYAEVA
jgi:dCMP deaminase